MHTIMHTIDYAVDGEAQTTTSHELTPRQILTNAGVDPATHYLVQLEGHHRISYQDKMDEPIKMHEKMRFISVSLEPTPVS